ncbi:MAG: Ku protein [Thermodesulfobacteria bacterium]|nr:Ku protein [Thermodesulfobacteriota bacterium]
MKATWSGFIRIGLVTIPVKLYPAVVKRAISFHLIHKDCGSRIKYLKYCPRCDKVLSDDDIVRAYFLDKEHYVVITDEELAKLKLASSDTIEVKSFVNEKEVAPIYFADAHYLLPDGEGAEEAFAVFYKAMEETGRAALGEAVIRQRQYPFLIKPYEGKFLASTLHFYRDVIRAEDLRVDVEAKADPRYLEMAKMLIESLSEPFQPEKLVDHYAEALMKLIEAKARGEKFEPKAEEEKAKVVNLMEALEASIKAAKKEAA